MKNKLILLRHGQSVWNKKNIFTGWVDIPLSRVGIQEALEAGYALRNTEIDLIYTSTLVRGIETALLAMSEHTTEKVPLLLHEGEERSRSYGNHEFIPIFPAWQLNERMYGELQGRNKDEMREKFGKEQIHIWRRSFDVAPPGGESLKMTAERTLPYFNEKIVPNLREGKNVLIAAHGNSLRSIVMELDSLSEEEVLSLEIPTGVPLIYSYNQGTFEKDALL